MTAYNTRSASSIWLVGATNETFQTSKLPSRGDILKVLFYYHTDEAMSLKESIDKSVSLLLPIWEMARIPTKARNHVVEHVRKLHAEWQCLKKNINRSSATNLSNQEKFCERLDDLFDIAHQGAMSTIKIEEDRLFLVAQREKGRRGKMGGVDKAHALKEERAIYSIKMWLFRKQYEPLQPGASSRKSRGLSYGQKMWNHLQEVSLFITKVYLKYWFESPAANCAPRQDLELLCALSEYPNTEIAKAATTAFGRHLWYLSETLVALGFFDDAVTIEEKRLMVLSLKEVEGSDEPLKRIQPFQHPTTKKLHNFVTKSTINFFTILGLSHEFLQVDPSDWEFQPEYQESKRLVLSLKVINDLAERGVALIQEFNSSLTRNEEQKQYLLQVVENHRKKFSAPTKSSAVDAKLQLLANSK